MNNMFLLLLTMNASTRFYIKQSTGNKFLSKLNDKLILSGFYSPVEFNFSYSEYGHINLADANLDKNLVFSEDTIAVQNNFSLGDNSFKIVFDGDSKFFIMKNNKCLEAETNLLIPSRKLKVVFKECKFNENQLWSLLMKSNELVKPQNIISKYYEHNKHTVYAHTLNDRTPLHGYYYHNYRNRLGHNVILYHHHRNKHSVLKERNERKIFRGYAPNTE